MSLEALAGAATGMPTKRLGRPEDLAAAAVLLASEEGGHINCHTLAIDGGDFKMETKPGVKLICSLYEQCHLVKTENM